MQRLLPGLAGLVLLGLAGLVVPAGQAGEITGSAGGLSLGTRVNGQMGGSCGAGDCGIGGGTKAGPNLFHRFASFDTRGGIRSVLFDTQGQRTLVVGVVNPLGSFLDKPIGFSSPASLIWLSPGGVHLGGGVGFVNIPSLQLSTATGLRVGGGMFDVMRTTAAQAAQLSGEPLAGRAGLVSDPASLAAASLSANGDVTLSSGLLTVDHELLLDAQGGHVLLQGGQIRVPGGSVELAGKSVTVAPPAGVSVGGASGGGTIRAQAGSGGLEVAGSLEARAEAPAAAGGRIELSGSTVALRGARLEASGPAGGGMVLVGGGLQGRDAAVPNAQATLVDGASTIRADATATGRGGTVVVWADRATRVDGAISARGGAAGGDGGFVETSGRQQLAVSQAPDASAPWGKGGTWLLDPNNLTVNATGPDFNISGFLGNYFTFGDSAVIAATTITTALNAGTSVTLSTSAGGLQAGDITVAAPISKTAGADASIGLNAHNNININADIVSSFGRLNLNLNPDSDSSGAGGTSLASAATLALNGGTATFNGTTTLAGTISDSTISKTGGPEITFDLATLSNVTIGSDLNTTGTLLLRGAATTLADGITVNFNSGNWVVAEAVHAIQLGAFPGLATINMNSGLSSLNTLQLGFTSGASLTIGPGVTLKGSGIITGTNPTLNTGLTNQGKILATTLDQLLILASNTLVNTGTIGTTAGQLFLEPTDPFTNQGILSIGSGAIHTGGRSFTNAISGTITTSGSGAHDLDLLGTATLTNAGTISPGGSGSAGTLNINGNLTLTSSSLLEIDLGISSGASIGGGLQNDRLNVIGYASLGGTLTASLAPGYNPPVGTTADILTASSFGGSSSLPSGSFTTTNLPADFSGTIVTPPAPANPTYRLSKAAPLSPCAGVCWDGDAGDNLWSTATNWTLDTLPGLSDTAYLNLASGASVLLNDSRTIAALFSDSGNSLNIVSGGSLTLIGSTTASDLQGSLAISGGTLTVDGLGATVNSLQLSSGTLSGSGDVTVTGGSTLSGVSFINGTGLLITDSNTSVTGTVAFGNKTWNNLNGRTVTISGAAQIRLDGENTVNNAGAFSIEGSNVTPIQGLKLNNVFNNGGTLTKGVGSAASSTITLNPGGSFNNSGLVSVNEGTLQLDNFPTNSGTLNIASGAALSTNGNNLTNAATTGVIRGEGTLNLGGLTLTNAGTISPGAPSFSPGLPGTAGTLTINGNLALAPTSQLQIDLLGSSTFAIGNDRLVVNGTASIGGTLTASTGSFYTPPVGTTVDIITATSFNNFGFTTINLPAGFSGNVATPPAPASLTYRLSKVACAGVCWDGGGGSSSRFWSTAANWSLDTLPGISDSVYLNMPGGASVLLNDTRTIAALFSDIGNNLAIINGGSLAVTGAATASDLQGDLTIAGGNLTLDGLGSTLNVFRFGTSSPGIPPGTLGGSGTVTVMGGSSLSGGTLSGTGTFITDSATTVSGSIAVEKPWTNAATRTLSQTGSAQVFVGSGNTITNAGIWNLDGSAATPIASNNGIGTFTNAVGGTLNKNTASVVSLNPSGGFNNNGTLNVNGGGLLVGSSFAQAGTIAVAAGASFEKFGGFTNAPGGVIEGAGVVNVGFGNTLTNAGTISPGTPSLSPGLSGTVGTLTINGDLALTSTSQLFIDLEGGEGAFDKLVVNGNASLGGTLTASLAPGYTPPVGSTFDIVTATSFSGGSSSLPSGSFTTTNLPTDFSGTTVTPPAPASPTYRLSKGALVSPCAGVCWDGGGGDNLWSTATNWTLDTLPGLSDTAYLNLLGGASVLLDNSQTIAALFSDAGNNLIIASGGSLTLLGTGSGDSRLDGSLTLQAGGSLSLNGTGLQAVEGLLNEGLVVINSHQSPGQGDAYIRIPSDQTFENRGRLDLNFTQSFGGWSLLSNPEGQDGIFTNSGRVNLNSGSTAWEIAFNNTAAGQVTLASNSVLSVQNGQTLAGTFQLGAGSTLWFSERHGADATFQAATIQGPGVIQVLGSLPRVRVDAATQFQSATDQAAGLPGLLLGSSGSVLLDGAARWSTYSQSGGFLGGSGTLEVLRSYERSGGSVAPTLAAVTLNQASGDLRVADLDVAGPLSLTAEAGSLNLAGFLAADRIQAFGSTGLSLESGTVLEATSPSGVAVVLQAGNGALANQAGSTALSVAMGATWQVYSASPLTPQENLGSLGYNFKQYGKSFTDITPVAGSGNGLFYAFTPILEASLSGSTSKVYDGSLTAVVDPAQVKFSGLLPGDAVSLGATGPAFYDSRDVGSGKLVTLTGVGVATASEGSIPVYGYRVAGGSASGPIGVITPATVFGGFNAADKTFDGSTTATILNRLLSGAVPGDQVALVGGSASFITPDVGTIKPVFGTGFQLAGLDRGNYTLFESGLITVASILQAPPPPPTPTPTPATGAVLPPLSTYPIFGVLQVDPLTELIAGGSSAPSPSAGDGGGSSSGATGGSSTAPGSANTVGSASGGGRGTLNLSSASDLGWLFNGSDLPEPEPAARARAGAAAAPAAPAALPGASSTVLDLADPAEAYSNAERKAPAIAEQLGLGRQKEDQAAPPSSLSLQEWMQRNTAAVRQGAVTP